MKRLLYKLWRILPLPFFVRAGLMWAINPKFLIGVDGIILNARQEILLFKHTYRKEHPWGLPSGYLIKGEDPADAVTREIYEESGFNVRITRLLEAYRFRETSRIGLIYQGELIEETGFIPSEEVQEAGFFALDSLPDLTEHQIELIKKYC